MTLTPETVAALLADATPGPWEFRIDEPAATAWHEEAEWSVVAPGDNDFMGFKPYYPWQGTLQDARLIAAAPALATAYLAQAAGRHQRSPEHSRGSLGSET